MPDTYIGEAGAGSGQNKQRMLDRRRKLDLLVSQLESERSSWLSHWRDLSDYILPRRWRFVTTDRNRGVKKQQQIIDSTATLAARTLAAGMMSGITSPSRPWFKLTVPDPQQRESMAVKRWLETVEMRMREVFVKSNLYTALSICYQDLGVFGTHAMIELEDDEDTVRFFPLPIGSYMLANSARGQVDTLVRKFSMTARQMIDEFGKDKVSTSVRTAAEQQAAQEQWFDVVHVVMPNDDYAPEALESRRKRFYSCWFEWAAEDRDKFLRESGYDEFPVLAPRWSTTGEDVYGYGPGMDALPDVKALQVLQKRKAQAIEKMVNPPLKGPSSLRNQRASLLPGDITYMDGPGEGLRPIHEVQFNLGDAVEDIREHQARIRSALYQDLFLMLQQSDRREITATEIQAREQERMLQLGPVLERLNDELLDPLIDRTFSIMVRKGMIPPAPPELQGRSLRVEYVSIMAQAQRMLGITSVDRLMGFAGNIAAVDPQIMDRIDTDATVSEYATMLGVSPKLLRGDDEVAAVRQQRAQAMAQRQAVENANMQAKSAELLSKTDTQRPSALNDLLTAVRGP